MDKFRCTKISKYLSYHLRHRPDQLSLNLAPGGWVNVDELLAACAKNQFPISPSELHEVVKNNDKQRFSFDPTHTLIRANQGHSTAVDLQLEALTPPATLYHGTGQPAVESILREGLKKMSRHHVHLSRDFSTAKTVGSRQGSPVVFEINAAAMHQAGYSFYCSENGVWLVEQVPPEYLQKVSSP